MPEAAAQPTMEAIVNLAKRRGFVFPSQELYGGVIRVEKAEQL